MKSVFIAILLLNFCQPQAATLQLAGVVPEKSVVQENHHQIHPQKNCRVYWAPVESHHAPKWHQVSKPVKVKSSCHVKVTAL